MDLQLTLNLDRPEYLRGESVYCTITLRNSGNDPVEIPMMSLSDTIVSFQLSRSDKDAGCYDWTDAQRRMGEARIFTDRMVEQPLEPGATEELRRDLIFLSGPLDPGDYSITAHYDFEDLHLESPTLPFKVISTQPSLLAAGSDTDLGGPHHLLLAYIDQLENPPVLMQATSFGSDHRLFGWVKRLATLDAKESVRQMVITRGVGKMAGSTGAILWSIGQQLYWTELGADAPGTIFSLGVDLPGFSIVDHPYRMEDGPAVVLVADAERQNAQVIQLEMNGSNEILGQLSLEGASLAGFLYNPLLGPVCVVATSGPKNILKVRYLQDPSADRELWSSSYRICALSTTFNEKREPVLAIVARKDGDSAVSTFLFTGDDFGRQQDGPVFTIDPQIPFEMAVAADESIHILSHPVNSDSLYGNGENGLETIQSLKGWAETPRLLTGRSGSAFAYCADEKNGVVLLPLHLDKVPATLGAGQE